MKHLAVQHSRFGSGLPQHPFDFEPFSGEDFFACQGQRAEHRPGEDDVSWVPSPAACLGPCSGQLPLGRASAEHTLHPG